MSWLSVRLYFSMAAKKTFCCNCYQPSHGYILSHCLCSQKGLVVCFFCLTNTGYLVCIKENVPIYSLGGSLSPSAFSYKMLATLVEDDPKVLFLIATIGESATLFPGLLHFTLDPYHILLNVKQGGIKYYFLSLWWYDSTWDWTPVSWAIGKHSNHHTNVWSLFLLRGH